MAKLPEESIRHFSSFDEFYPFYLEEHANRSSRRLHFIGTSLALLLFVYALATRRWALLILVPVVGYGFAWLGHSIFEKNRPTTFRHPLYSLMGDFRMWFDMLRGTGAVLSRQASTSSGHGTMVDFTVFIAIASATARDTPSSVNG